MFTGIVERLVDVVAIEPTAAGRRLVVDSGYEETPHIGDSIAVNGVCLTAVQLHDDGFDTDVSVETLDVTTLKNLDVGDAVNLEADIVSKYLAHHLRFMQGREESQKPAAWLAAGDE